MSRASRRPAARTGDTARKRPAKPSTERAYRWIAKQWQDWAAAERVDPRSPIGDDVRRWTAHSASTNSAGALTTRLSALAWHLGPDARPDQWPAARHLVAAIAHRERDARRDGTAAPRPQPAPLLRDDAKALAAAHTRTLDDHPDRIARGRAALLALAAGITADRLAAAGRPAPDDPGTGPLRLPDAAGREPIVLPDTPAGPGLPSPAQAARDLHRRLPVQNPRLYANTTRRTQPHDQPPAPITDIGNAARSLHGQVSAAARRANTPWPRSRTDAPAAAQNLPPDRLALVHELCDPAVIRRARDHAHRVVGDRTALRGININALDRSHASRNSHHDGLAAWTLHVVASKTRPDDDTRLLLRRHPDPDLDPVAALDRITALTEATGRAQGPLIPALDSTGTITGRRHINASANNALAAAAKAAGLDKRLTTRSHRLGASTQTILDGGDLRDVQQLTGNTAVNAGRYVRGIRPYVLRF